MKDRHGNPSWNILPDFSLDLVLDDATDAIGVFDLLESMLEIEAELASVLQQQENRLCEKTVLARPDRLGVSTHETSRVMNHPRSIKIA